MYASTPAIAALWRELFARLAPAGLVLEWLEHPAPRPLDSLWRRPDNAAVFMCGLPFATGAYAVQAVAAPIFSPAAYEARPQYCSEFVVRADSAFESLEQTFGRRIVFTAPDSQSGFAAALEHLAPFAGRAPLYDEVIAPRLTPLGSLTAMSEGVADVAPVDSYALDLLRRHAPWLTARLRSVARTACTPSPLLVASSGAEVGALRAAFLDSHNRAELGGVLQSLLLRGFAPVEPGAYRSLAARFAAARRTWRQWPLARRVDAAFL